MTPAFDLYDGVSRLEHAEDWFDLGDGGILRRTCARLMTPFTMPFIIQDRGFHTAAHRGGRHVGAGFERV
ncbi:MAG: hypothetical protein QM722_15720 [Piscinibacter sp.]